ncbi:TPA: replication initiator protein A [Streptococcus suis]|nr:replication initiator protein A [Streptococcus suis]
MHIDEVRNNQFYQFPQWLLEEPYNKLSDRAKIMYMLLWDRRKLSVKNEWYDENGVVYVQYTNKKLMDKLNCSEPAIIKTKKELSEVGLLNEIRKGKNQANFLYISGAKEYLAHDLKSFKSGTKEYLAHDLKSFKSGTKEYLAHDLKSFKPSHTNINQTNINNINNNTSEQNPLKKIVYTIRQNWGKDLTPIELETVTNMLGDYPFEIIDFAISEATLRNKKTIRWVERCCLDWYVYNNLETVTAIQDYLLAKKSWIRKEADTPDPNYPPPY